MARFRTKRVPVKTVRLGLEHSFALSLTVNGKTRLSFKRLDRRDQRENFHIWNVRLPQYFTVSYRSFNLRE